GVRRRDRTARPAGPERPPGRLVLVLPGGLQHQYGRLRHRRGVRGHLDRGPVHLALRPDRAEVGVRPRGQPGPGRLAGLLKPRKFPTVTSFTAAPAARATEPIRTTRRRSNPTRLSGAK